MKKFISLCIIAAMLTGLFSSCANPPGSKPSSDTLPQPGDQPETDKIVAEPDPVDLSGLTEEELGRITEELAVILKESDRSNEITVCIFFNETEEEKNIESIINEKKAQKEKRVTEIESELQRLEEEKASLSDMQQNSTTNTTSMDNSETLSQRISELRKELKTYRVEYTELRVKMLENINKPIITAFAERHNIDLSFADNVSYTVSTIYGIKLTPNKIIELVKDDTVAFVDYLVQHDYAELGEVSDSSSSRTTDSSEEEKELDITKVNEVYNIIDGEIAANAGYTGSDRMECV